MKQLIDVVEGIFDDDIMDKADNAAVTPIRDLKILDSFIAYDESGEKCLPPKELKKAISYYFDDKKLASDARKHKPMGFYYRSEADPILRILSDIPGSNWIEDSAEVLRGYLKKGIELEIRNITHEGPEHTSGEFYIHDPNSRRTGKLRSMITGGVSGFVFAFGLDAYYDMPK